MLGWASLNMMSAVHLDGCIMAGVLLVFHGPTLMFGTEPAASDGDMGFWVCWGDLLDP